MSPMIPRDAALRGAKAEKRPYRFSVRDVARAAGRSIHTARKDRTKGIWTPSDLWSVARYILFQEENK